ncbi:hypothetical protein AKO1_014081 [Acrasis kona]|uniref:Uncharacterized protein n=1 Tax=Acrasis kona TaxID=1008807 RepID=A0AAW2Z4I6_9EUKA
MKHLDTIASLLDYFHKTKQKKKAIEMLNYIESSCVFQLAQAKLDLKNADSKSNTNKLILNLEAKKVDWDKYIEDELKDSASLKERITSSRDDYYLLTGEEGNLPQLEIEKEAIKRILDYEQTP